MHYLIQDHLILLKDILSSTVTPESALLARTLGHGMRICTDSKKSTLLRTTVKEFMVSQIISMLFDLASLMCCACYTHSSPSLSCDMMIDYKQGEGRK